MVHCRLPQMYAMADIQPFTKRVLAAPFVINGALKCWPSRKWTVGTLAETLVDKTFRCRLMPLERESGGHPAWESEGVYVECLLKEFNAWCQGEAREDNPLAAFSPLHFSAYIDYKYMTQMFAGLPHLLKEVQWSTLGLADVDGGHSTMWIGSSGASTPCHYDTYGFNLVAQVQGRKRWVLFPPEDSSGMYPTRIPYEESSVFSQVDLACPDLRRFPHFKKGRPVVVTLEPGQVLYVPRHWWHYVTCTQMAVSINTWVEMKEDTTSRLGEAVTRVLASSLIPYLSQTAGSTVEDDWINPTEELEPASSNVQYLKAALLSWQQAYTQDCATQTTVELDASDVPCSTESCALPTWSTELDHSHAQTGTVTDNTSSGKTDKHDVCLGVRTDYLGTAHSKERCSDVAPRTHVFSSKEGGSDVNISNQTEQAVSSDVCFYNRGEHAGPSSAVSSEHSELNTPTGIASVCTGGNQEHSLQKHSELKTFSIQEDATEARDQEQLHKHSDLNRKSLYEAATEEISGYSHQTQKQSDLKETMPPEATTEKTDQCLSNRNARLLQLAEALQQSTVQYVDSPFTLSEHYKDTLGSVSAQTHKPHDSDAAGDLKREHTDAVSRKRKNPDGLETSDGSSDQSDQESFPQIDKKLCKRENEDDGRDMNTPETCSERGKGAMGDASIEEVGKRAESPELKPSVFVPRPCCLQEYLTLIGHEEEDQGMASCLEEDEDSVTEGTAEGRSEGECLNGVLQEALLKSVLHPDVVKLIVEKLNEHV